MPKDMIRDEVSLNPVTEAKIDSPPEPIFRKPTTEDGAGIFGLIRDCKPLDENSRYCNLIQADHFRDTCVVVELEGEIIGWVSGHMIPGEDAFFVWQVAVSPDARGMGLASRMLSHLVERDVCLEAKLLKTTITKDNEASWATFEKFAEAIGGALSDEPHFKEEDHFDGEASTEHLVSITIPRETVGLRAVA